MIRPVTGLERVQFATLFFLHAGAGGMWNVAFSNVLKAHGLEALVPYAFSCSAIAAFISPLIIGSLADQHLSADRLLRWLAFVSAIMLALTFCAIEHGWGGAWVLAFLQAQSLVTAPMWGLSTTIVLSRLSEPEQQFGPIRVWATLGWMAAGWFVSWVLDADTSTVSGFAASLVFLALGLFTYTLPDVPPLERAGIRSWRDLFGARAFSLLRNPDHRVVFVTATLFSIPLAAFFPYTTLQLRDLGVDHIAATMSLGQTTEVLTLFWLGRVLRGLRLKWIFLAGIALGFVRFGLFALNTKAAVITGIILHGCSFTLFFITAQIYLELRVAPELRARAQALVTVMTVGIGNLAGYLGCGGWLAFCRRDAAIAWPHFWLGLSAVIGAVFVFFAAFYRGSGGRREAAGDARTG